MTEHEMRAMLSSSSAGAEAALVWRQGMTEWMSSSNLEEAIHLQPAPGKDEAEAASAGSDEWYYAAGDTSTGPVTPATIVSAMEAGKVSGSTLVWRQGLGEWIPLAECDELAKVVHKAFADQATSKTTDTMTPPASGSSEGDGVAGRKRQRTASKPAGGNPWVYIAGLPPNATSSEILAHFRCVGQVRADPSSGKPMLRLYRHKPTAAAPAGTMGAPPSRSRAGALKGDASMCFADEASVALAIQMLDGVPLRPTAGQSTTSIAMETGEAGGWPLSISQAEFRDRTGKAVLGHTQGADSMRRPAPATAEASGTAACAEEAAVVFADLPKRARLVVAEEATRHARLAWEAGGSVAAVVRRHDLRRVVVARVFGGRGLVSQHALDAMKQAVLVECERIGRCSVLAARAQSGGSVLVEFEAASRAQAAVTTFQPDSSLDSHEEEEVVSALVAEPGRWESRFWDGTPWQ